MNKIINKFSLTGDIFTPEFHLNQQGFSYGAPGVLVEHLLNTVKEFKNLEKQVI